jgi:hypothetical protein
MKYLALLAVLVVIYMVFLRASPVNSVKEAMDQTEMNALSTGPRAAATAPATVRGPAPAAATPNTTGLRAPITRTHAALDAVKARNGAGEF